MARGRSSRATRAARRSRSARRRLSSSPGESVTASEEAWLPRLDGSKSLRRLAAEPGADELELFGLVYALHVTQHLDLSGEPQPQTRSEHDPTAVDLRRIEERLRLAREADYFAL